MAIPHEICFDFGTSSIRCAVRGGRGNAVAVELGEAVGSSIDRASIPSACFISADKSNVCFGEVALQKGLRGDPAALFEISPKSWMTSGSPESLDSPAVSGLAITKRDLLAGLLAQAWSALAKALEEPVAELGGADVRVSHPVWEKALERQMHDYLYHVLNRAFAMAGKTDRVMGIAAFERLSRTTPTRTQAGEVDVIEPVAATVESYRNARNAREACMVVDVGAGTTDMALFISVTPDERARVRRKFIPMTEPISVRKAGDLIDQAVNALVISRARRLDSVAKEDLARRRRLIKEELFRLGQVVEYDATVSLIDVEKHELITEMKRDITRAASGLLSSAKGMVEPYVRATMHRIDRIDVVFVGGGAGIGFLQKAVQDAARGVKLGVPAVIRTDGVPSSGNLPAAFERLAVALGGTTPAANWPETRMKEPEHLRLVH